MTILSVITILHAQVFHQHLDDASSWTPQVWAPFQPQSNVRIDWHLLFWLLLLLWRVSSATVIPVASPVHQWGKVAGSMKNGKILLIATVAPVIMRLQANIASSKNITVVGNLLHTLMGKGCCTMHIMLNTTRSPWFAPSTYPESIFLFLGWDATVIIYLMHADMFAMAVLGRAIASQLALHWRKHRCSSSQQYCSPGPPSKKEYCCIEPIAERQGYYWGRSKALVYGRWVPSPTLALRMPRTILGCCWRQSVRRLSESQEPV